MTIAATQGLDARYAFNLSLQLFNQAATVNTTPLAAVQALQSLQMVQDSAFFQQTQAHMPGCGCIPPPSVQQSGAPAGRGLRVDADGWPEGTITTAGGYRIVPEGRTNWEIYAPGQQIGDKAHTRIWGDPHVTEKDGTRWDFTRSSDFVLPDGTRIHCRTSSDRGHSVSTGLEIINGADRVSVSNLNGADPQVSDVKHDGYPWRAQHLAANPDGDSFHLRGDDDTVHWVREREGELDGVVTGAYFDRGERRYEQRVDEGNMSFLSPEMRPPLGTPAWGNQLRSALNDGLAKLLGQHLGENGTWPAGQVAEQIAADHANAHLQTELRHMLFGGWAGSFNDMNSPYGALHGLVSLLKSESQWQHQLRFGWQQHQAYA